MRIAWCAGGAEEGSAPEAADPRRASESENADPNTVEGDGGFKSKIPSLKARPQAEAELRVADPNVRRKRLKS